MSDFEILYIVMMMLSIIVTILIAYIEGTKSNRHLTKDCGYFL